MPARYTYISIRASETKSSVTNGGNFRYTLTELVAGNESNVIFLEIRQRLIASFSLIGNGFPETFTILQKGQDVHVAL